jgi:hypothetical protein
MVAAAVAMEASSYARVFDSDDGSKEKRELREWR